MAFPKPNIKLLGRNTLNLTNKMTHPKCSAKVSVLIDKFKNIELFKQGLYQLRLSVASTLYYAEPQQIWTLNSKLTLQSSSNLIPSQIISYSYFSKAFLVRFQSEVIKLDEVCVFSIELPIRDSPDLTLQAELLYSNFDDSKPSNQNLRLLSASICPQVISTKFIRIPNPHIPVFQYVPLSFDPDYMCCFDSLVQVYFEGYQMPLGEIKTGLFGSKTFAGAQEINASFLYLSEPLKLSLKSLEYQLLLVHRLLGYKKDEEKDSDTLDFYEAIKTHNTYQVASSITKKLSFFSRKIECLFRSLVELMQPSINQVISYLSSSYFSSLQTHFTQQITCEEVQKSLRIEPWYFNSAKKPVFKVENFQKNCKISGFKDISIVVLVHGFKGSSYDMHLIKGYISQIYPQTKLLVSKSNEKSSDASILQQGENLAAEVKSFLSGLELTRVKLSFICHSMGGLVARAALPKLENYKSCLLGFVSLSCPHLGLETSSSVLLEVGKLLYGLAGSSLAFSQLSMTDSHDLRNTLLYDMSSFEGLNWFQQVVLFSNKQDAYVSTNSARIEAGNSVYKEMCRNLLFRVKQVTRVDVDLGSSLRPICLDNPHIDFIDNIYLVQMMLYSFKTLLN